MVGITIPDQPEALKPFLVAHTVDENDRRIDIVFGYAERRRAGIEPLRIQDLQGLLKSGRQLTGVTERLEAMAEEQRQLRQLLEERPGPLSIPPEPAVGREEFGKRRDAARKAVGFEHVEPWFSFAAIPTPAVELPHLFAGANAELVRALNHPPRLRAGGFDLATGEPAHIVAGRLRRSLLVGAKVLDVHRDGVVIFVGDAKEFLCWGTLPRSGVPLRLNPLALCESAYAYAIRSETDFPAQVSEVQRVHLASVLDVVDDQDAALEFGPGRRVHRRVLGNTRIW